MKNTYKKETLESIFKAALRLFARFGYKKATVEDIASELGMTKGNLYFYVKNKKDLYEKTVAHALSSWQEYVRQEISIEKDDMNKLIIMFQKGNEYLIHNSDLQTILINDPGIISFSTEEDRFSKINDGTRNMLKGILDNGKKEGRFRDMNTEHVTSLVYNAFILFVVKAYIKTEGESITEIFQEGAKILLYGIINSDSQ